jgi:hypothetical protein
MSVVKIVLVSCLAVFVEGAVLAQPPLKALFIYAVITGRTPEGLTSQFKSIRGGIAITKGEAAKMQKAAWEQHLENNPPPHALK